MDLLIEAGETEDLVLTKAGFTGQMMAAALHLNATEDEFDRAIRYINKLVEDEKILDELVHKHSLCSWVSLVLRHSAKFLKQM